MLKHEDTIAKVFKIEGDHYTLKHYSDEDVCKYIYEKLGSVADKMTVYEFRLLCYMMNIGFVPSLSYYGRPTGEMYPQDMWYSYIGMSEDGDKGDIIDIKLCCKISYDKDKAGSDQVVVYEGGNRCFKIGTFGCIDDVVRIFRLRDYIPAKVHIARSSISEIVDRADIEKWCHRDEIQSGDDICPESFIMYGVGRQSEIVYMTDFSRLEKYER